MRKKVAIIGANEFQKKLVSKASEIGFETHVFAWEEGAVAKEAADFFYPVSITEKEQILTYVKNIRPDGICSVASDLAMPTVNYIANSQGFVANTLECTELTTNKYKMRNALSANNLPCPRFQLVKELNEIDYEELKFPLIIKPIDRSGSRGVYKVDSINEAKEAIHNAQKVSFVDQVLIEEYIYGKEYSVEFISQNGEHTFLQITEKFTTGSPNFIEKGHLSPARLSDDVKNAIVLIIRKALDVLKVQNGASHSEVKVTSSGVIKIIEIAARMGGDFIGSDMVYISTGYDFLKNTINVAVNEPMDLKQNQPSKIALVGFIFTQQDKENFEVIFNRYRAIVKEYQINSNMNVVTDSSTRNGYYILEIGDRKMLPDILAILSMEENSL